MLNVYRLFVIVFVFPNVVRVDVTSSPVVAEPEFVFHGEEWVETFLLNVSNAFPSITHLYSIGKSVQGRDLWVIAIGESPRDHKFLRPEVKYVGNIHGNEVVSRELLVQLIYYLVHSYGHNRTITRFLNTTRLHILVSLNPDGFATAEATGGRGDCRGVKGRGNFNNFDLNRNFPDYFVTNPVDRQQETTAMMDWMERNQFVLSGALHGGALVVNYPYDNLPYGMSEPSHSPTSDDDVFVHLAKVYSFTHPTMHRGFPCPHDRERFENGIVNGASWYLVTGSMQDYNYIFHGCMELTLEISCCKFPSNDKLELHWNENKNALVKLITQVHMGVKGVVQTRDGRPIAGAVIKVVGRLHGTKTTELGEFWRLLLPGDYTIKVTSEGYESEIFKLRLAPKLSESRRVTRNVVRSDVTIWSNDVADVTVLEITLDESNVNHTVVVDRQKSLTNNNVADSSVNVVSRHLAVAVLLALGYNRMM